MNGLNNNNTDNNGNAVNLSIKYVTENTKTNNAIVLASIKLCSKLNPVILCKTIAIFG
jgi:hypothetical protein